MPWYRLERFRGCTQGWSIYNVVDEYTGRLVGYASELPSGILKVHVGSGCTRSTYYVKPPSSYLMPLRVYLP